MNFNQLAYLNVTRNKKLYLGYFLSNAFSVMVFFTFLVFALHPQLIAAHAFVTAAMLNAAIVIIIFSIFYIGYSMSAFLQMRKKEFGILMMNGLSPKQLRALIFRENVIIGLLANIFGILFGIPLIFIILIFSKQFIMVELSFYFPLLALLITIVLFVMVFGALSYFIGFRVSRQKLLTLIKSDKTAVPQPKTSIIRTCIAILFLGAGYTIALKIDAMNIIIAFIPVMLLVIIGTYYLFTQTLVFFANVMKNRPRTFFKKQNILLLSDMSYRVKDNAQSFFFITIITTVVFAAMGTLFSFQEVFSKSFTSPYDVSFQTLIEPNQDSESWDLVKDTIIKADTSATFIEARGLQFIEDEKTVFIALSDYNTFAKASNTSTLLLSNGSARYFQYTGLKQEVVMSELLSGFELEAISQSASTTIPIISSYFVITDSDFASLLGNSPQHFLLTAAKTTLPTEELVPLITKVTEQVETLDPVALVSSDRVLLYQVYIFYGPILFIGIFISIIFFLCAGSFLYFRLYRDIEQDYQKFASIAKIGLTNKELTTVVTKQLAMLFGIPLIVASCNGLVALTTMAKIFDEPLMLSSIIIVIIFVIIQIIYFLIARFFYLKKLRDRLFPSN